MDDVDRRLYTFGGNCSCTYFMDLEMSRPPAAHVGAVLNSVPFVADEVDVLVSSEAGIEAVLVDLP